jgi:hypothetical protein
MFRLIKSTKILQIYYTMMAYLAKLGILTICFGNCVFWILLVSMKKL